MGFFDDLFDTSQTSTSTSTTTPSEAQRKLWEFLGNQLFTGFGATPGGGLGGFSQFQPSALPQGQELDWLQGIQNLASDPNLVQPAEEFGLRALQDAADPTSRLKAAQEAYSTISAPSLVNYASAAGQGRSGGMLEALNQNAINTYTLPILNQVAQAQGQLGQSAIGLGGTLENRGFSRMGAGLAAAAAPRQAYLAEYLRPYQGLMSLLGGTAGGGGGGSTTTGSQTGPGTNWLTQVMVPLLSSWLMR